MKMIRAIALVGVVFAMAALVQGQMPPKTQPGTVPPNPNIGVNPTPWFTNPQVQQHLKFNDDQFKGLSKAYQDAWMSYQKGITNMDKGLSGPERQKRIYELQQEFSKSFNPATGKILTDPTQRLRYDQLQWQYQGIGAFSDPTVAERLKLTPAQSDKLLMYQQEWMDQMQKLAPLYQGDRELVLKRFAVLRAQNGDRIDAVLTPEQRATWREIIGNPYPFGPDVYFPAPTGK